MLKATINRFYFILFFNIICLLQACVMPFGPYREFETDTTSRPEIEEIEYAWLYNNNVDRMTSDSIFSASIQSENRLYFAYVSKRHNYSSTKPYLYIIKRNKKSNVALSIEGAGNSVMFNVKGDSVKLTMRCDDKAPLKLIGRLPADDSRTFIFIDSPDSLIAKIKRSKHLLIQIPLVFSEKGSAKRDKRTGVTHYQNGHETYKSEILEFNSEGLKW